MISKDGSQGIDELGEPFDYGFTIEIGRVQYAPNEDGTYTTVLTLPNGTANPEIETRSMSLDALTEWYTNPTPSYYEENIKNTPKE